MRILTAIITLLLLTAFVSWTAADVACTALAWQCAVDDDPEG